MSAASAAPRPGSPKLNLQAGIDLAASTVENCFQGGRGKQVQTPASVRTPIQSPNPTLSFNSEF